VSAILVMLAAAAATPPSLHEPIRTGHMGLTFPLYVVPALGLTLAAWALTATRFKGAAARVGSLAVLVLAACGAFTLLRTDGVMGEGSSQFRWRWTPTAEQLLLARGAEAPLAAPRRETTPAAEPAAASTPDAGPAASSPAADASAAAPPIVAAAEPAPDRPIAKRPAVWPGFRGPGRDSVVHGVRIAADWSQSPPVELWRRPVGPGWSSFAVDGDFIYTQEQRGEHEVVACYRLSTGAPVWQHRDAVRFWESNGGAGPRGTPAVHDGHVYALGATGIVNALDAATGRLAWSRDSAADTGAQMPGWGFAGSPLVVDGLVIVAASGRLVAYESASGQPRWTRTTRGGGYSSPHLMTIDGVAQVVLLSAGGATAVSPRDGAVLWEHAWQSDVAIVQPARAAERDLLLTVGDAMGGLGMRRVSLDHGASGWTAAERWTSRGLKPYFNDYVVHEGHAYGFDGSILSCIDLETGERRWKGGRYGHGQFLLLADQDLLLVLSEEGALALVRAAPDGYTELAKAPALEGKTWNHPALVGDVVLVRNGEEMAAFRLPPAPR
jgi:outer membrane protein assembly factor BamB